LVLSAWLAWHYMDACHQGCGAGCHHARWHKTRSAR
jgi:hypothetical protein